MAPFDELLQYMHRWDRYRRIIMQNSRTDRDEAVLADYRRRFPNEEYDWVKMNNAAIAWHYYKLHLLAQREQLMKELMSRFS
jgi:hypothetical protein